MTFKELIDRQQWGKVKKKLLKLYPKEKKNLKGYEIVFKGLKKLKPKPQKMQIELVPCHEQEGYYWTNVHGKYKSKRQGYAIEYSPWEEWLGMEIEAWTTFSYSEIDIVCHCLWEMTWNGFTQEDVDEKNKELIDRVEK